MEKPFTLALNLLDKVRVVVFTERGYSADLTSIEPTIADRVPYLDPTKSPLWMGKCSTPTCLKHCCVACRGRPCDV